MAGVEQRLASAAARLRAVAERLAARHASNEPLADDRDTPRRRASDRLPFFGRGQQQLLATMMSSVTEGVVVVDCDGHVLMENQAALRIDGSTVDSTGAKLWCEAVGASRLDATPLLPEEMPTLRACRGEDVSDLRLLLRGPRGDRRTVVEVRASPLRGANREVFGAIVCFSDVTDRQPAPGVTDAAGAAASAVDLERAVATIAEQQRRRLGRDVHDSLGQQLTSIGLLVAALRGQLASGAPLEPLTEHLAGCVDVAKAQLQAVLRGLTPVDVGTPGLPAALDDLAQATRMLHRVACRFEAAGAPTPALDDHVAQELYLIAREAVHNAVKHGRPGLVVIRLACNDGLRLVVHDDGVGMAPHDAAARGLGLQIMRHRAQAIGAELAIESPPRGGTAVVVTLPDAEARRAHRRALPRA